MTTGVNGASAVVDYSKWMTPGAFSFYPFGSGATAEIRCGGASVYIYDNDCATEIASGLPADWSSKNPATDYISPNPHNFVFAIPRWQI
jgi:hypothetical protein